jgi:hypothetical protein
MRAPLPALAWALLALAAGSPLRAAPATALPPVRHVFVLVLENQSYESTFGPDSPAPYLARVLPGQGALLRQYYAIGHASLPNYVAIVSGQAPNEQTQLDCPVYPRAVRTLPDQLEAAGFTWKAYMEDMGNNPAREPASCGHVPVGQPERAQQAQLGDQYAVKHDPFVYFHSIIDDRARCDAHVVNLTYLPADLASAATTPNFVFITPNLCNDGHDPQCVDGRAGGLVAIERFLRQWVPLIERTAAFRADGLLIVTFDESDHAGPAGSSACCGERPLPGAKYPPGFNGPGGGRIGAVVLSPFVRPGTVSDVPYNHYALLRTIEALFGLPYLGYAAQADLQAFGADVLTAQATPRPRPAN